MSLAQTPARAPPNKVIARRGSLVGAAGGGLLASQGPPGGAPLPHERDVPGPRLGHAIGTERFSAVTSGVAGRHAPGVAGEALAQRRPGGVQLGRGGVDAAQLLGELEGAFGLGPVGQEAAGLPAQVALSGRADQVGRLVPRPIPRGARFGERALPSRLRKHPDPGWVDCGLGCLSVEHDEDQGGVLVVAFHWLPLPPIGGCFGCTASHGLDDWALAMPPGGSRLGPLRKPPACQLAWEAAEPLHGPPAPALRLAVQSDISAGTSMAAVTAEPADRFFL
jgi:hypothetical protein